MADKVKLAIILDNEEILLWQYQILEKLIVSDFADIKLFLVNEQELSKRKIKGYSMFYLLHEKIDKFIFRDKIYFDKKVRVLEELKDIPAVNLSDISLDGNLSNSTLINIRNYNLDLVLNFGNIPIHSSLLREFRFGNLTYNISKQIYQINALSCYWEVVKSMPEIEVSIQLVHRDPKENIELFRTGILPYPNSININRNNIYELASLLIPRIILSIHEKGDALLAELIIRNKTNSKLPEFQLLQHPTSLQAFLNLVALYFNFLIKKIQFHKIGRWFIIFKINDKNESLPDDPGSFECIKAPKSKFWADPFVISKENFHYIFIEEYLYKTEKGHISVLKLDGKGKMLSIEKIIEKPYHMSYPHIFEHGNSLYMVPETGSNKTIELYQCTDFPNNWVFVKNIMENISALDTTIFYFDSKWWLFTSIMERNTATVSFNELFLFYSDDLLTSNWKSHPKNPIVSDPKLSRSAGKIFITDNKIYRPSQDCSGIYGRALNLNCITKLSETDYEEVLVNKTEPFWDKKIKGIHTYSFNDRITVMDAFSFRKRIIN